MLGLPGARSIQSAIRPQVSGLRWRWILDRQNDPRPPPPAAKTWTWPPALRLGFGSVTFDRNDVVGGKGGVWVGVGVSVGVSVGVGVGVGASMGDGSGSGCLLSS